MGQDQWLGNVTLALGSLCARLHACAFNEKKLLWSEGIKHEQKANKQERKGKKNDTFREENDAQMTNTTLKMICEVVSH